MDVQEKIVARSIVVVDNEGEERISLDAGWADGSCTLLMTGKKGGGVAIECHPGSGPSITIRSTAGRGVATVVTTAEGDLWVAAYDAAGLPCVMFRSRDSDAGPANVEFRRDGKLIWSALRSGRNTGDEPGGK